MHRLHPSGSAPVNKSTKLSNIRNLLVGQKIEEGFGLRFVFLKKNAPISNKQEESVTLSRVAENGKHEKTMTLYLRSTDPLSSSTVPVAVPSSPDNNEVEKHESDHKDESALPYSTEEIQLSVGIEREKRTYWNKRIQDFAQDLHEKRHAKHEVYGIIDVEWSKKKSDLLKVMYNKAIRFLEEKDMELSSQTSLKRSTKSMFVSREMELAKIYEELCKAEFELKTCYQKIEDEHTKKRNLLLARTPEKQICHVNWRSWKQISTNIIRK